MPDESAGCRPPAMVRVPVLEADGRNARARVGAYKAGASERNRPTRSLYIGCTRAGEGHRPTESGHRSRWPDSRYGTLPLLSVGLSLRSLDGDASRLDLGVLRNGDFQHAVGLLRRDGLSVGALRQSEAAEEGTARALDALVAVLVGLLLLRAALAADSQHAILGGDVDVLRLNSRDVGEDHETLGFLVNIHARNPGNTGRARHRSVGCFVDCLIELPMQAIEERPGLVTHQCHKASYFDSRFAIARKCACHLICGIAGRFQGMLEQRFQHHGWHCDERGGCAAPAC